MFENIGTWYSLFRGIHRKIGGIDGGFDTNTCGSAVPFAIQHLHDGRQGEGASQSPQLCGLRVCELFAAALHGPGHTGLGLSVQVGQGGAGVDGQLPGIEFYLERRSQPVQGDLLGDLASSQGVLLAKGVPASGPVELSSTGCSAGRL